MIQREGVSKVSYSLVSSKWLLIANLENIDSDIYAFLSERAPACPKALHSADVPLCTSFTNSWIRVLRSIAVRVRAVKMCNETLYVAKCDRSGVIPGLEAMPAINKARQVRYLDLWVALRAPPRYVAFEVLAGRRVLLRVASFFLHVARPAMEGSASPQAPRTS